MPTQHTHAVLSSTPASLSLGKGAIAQTANATGLPPSNVEAGPGEALPDAIGLLLVALIGLVAISRRGLRQVGK